MRLDDLSLKLNYWFLSHKEQLRQWQVLLLLGMCFLLAIFFVVSATNYAAELPRMNRLIGAALADSAAPSIAATRPLPLSVRSAAAALVEGKAYDLIGAVHNPNTRWGVSALEFSFLVDGKETPRRTAYLLPNRTRHLVLPAFAHRDGSRPRPERVTLVLHDVRWKWIRDTEQLRNVDFAVADLVFTPRTLTRQGTEAATLTAQLRNASVVQWRTVDVGVILLGVDDVPLGANTLTVKDSEPQSATTIETSWPRAFPSGATAVIEATVNFFADETSAALPGYGSG